MIEFFSSWAKQIGVTIVIVSIFEMLLPNNKTKKYIRMILGVYVVFNLISPLIQSKEIFSLDNINLDNYNNIETSTVDQTSMEERIKELYEEELEKDIIKKLEEKGYQIAKCKVSAQISDNEEETKINKIKLNIEGMTDKTQENEEENMTAENRIVTEIQKIKKVDTNVTIDQEENTDNTENKSIKKLTKVEIQNIKKFLIEEYGVDEKCLEIN